MNAESVYITIINKAYKVFVGIDTAKLFQSKDDKVIYKLTFTCKNNSN